MQDDYNIAPSVNQNEKLIYSDHNDKDDDIFSAQQDTKNINHFRS